MKYTEKQIENWKRFEEVRQEGKYNMFIPNARLLTGLDDDEYSFCMKNYSELKDLIGKE